MVAFSRSRKSVTSGDIGPVLPGSNPERHRNRWIGQQVVPARNIRQPERGTAPVSVSAPHFLLYGLAVCRMVCVEEVPQ